MYMMDTCVNLDLDASKSGGVCLLLRRQNVVPLQKFEVDWIILPSLSQLKKKIRPENNLNCKRVCGGVCVFIKLCVSICMHRVACGGQKSKGVVVKI